MPSPNFQGNSNTGNWSVLNPADPVIKPPGRVNEYPNRFTATLVHEVRNPLTNITLSVQVLESAILDEELKKYLQIITRSSARINKLISDLLVYQQADEVQPEKHFVPQLLDEVLEMEKDRIQLKNIIVTKSYTPGNFQVALNRPQMIIALTNIIINAIDAMPNANGRLHLNTKLTEGTYSIEIMDNGCGISKENLQYIFKPYFTNKPGGLGLGLAATFDILLANNIGVNVESAVDEGTRFILFFVQ
ncbi:MAG: response regulator [Chitinophagaceae bacterium]|nr:response regulator [Chitinophagaceae bacterium]